MSHWYDILKFLAGFLTGFSLKWFFVWRSNRTTIGQTDNVVGGNLAGRDINIEERRR